MMNGFPGFSGVPNAQNGTQNPMQMYAQMYNRIAQNPSVMANIAKKYRGQDVRSMAIQTMQQRGIDVNAFMRQFGLK